LLDEPQVGASNLVSRCPEFRGKIVKFWDIFNLTSWSELIMTSKSEGIVWNGVMV